jgi:competence protein ComEA
MMHALFLKLGMLVMTMAVVFWIRWQIPDRSPERAASMDESSAASVRSFITAESETSGSDRIKTGPVSAKSRLSNDAHTAGNPSPRELLDLNSATADQLESLPGIGAALAQRVIAYRKSVGRFQAVEDLRAVKGIGVKKFDRIKPLVTVAAANVEAKAEKRPL